MAIAVDTYREQLSGNIVKLIMMYTVNVGRLEKMTLKILSKKQREENLILSSTKNRTYVILLVTKKSKYMYVAVYNYSRLVIKQNKIAF